MKKLLTASLVLFIFSFSIIIFQTSCNKTVDAQSSTSSSVGLKQLNTILFYKLKGTTYNYTYEIWIANFDGTNQKKLPVSIPTGMYFDDAKLSPDGKTLFYAFHEKQPGTNSYIYTCSIDGTNLKRILIDSSGTRNTLLETY